MEKKKLCGKAHKFGDHINTDLISPAQYMEMSYRDIAAHAMEGVDKDFSAKVQPGDMVVAGKNFGSGSSRETAPIALKECGVSVVIAEFFARIFYRNCLNIGLPALVCEQAYLIHDGDELQVDLQRGVVLDVTQGLELVCDALPPHIVELLDCGGLMGYLKKKAKED